MIYLQLFWSFFQICLFSVGGGYAAMPMIEAQAVTLHGWLTTGEFADLVSIAEMTPGPITINAATFVGTRIAGLPGALAATFGSILPSCILVSILAWAYRRWRSLRAVDHVLGALRPVVVALIASAGLTILLQALFPSGIYALAALNWRAVLIFLAALFALRKFRASPIAILAASAAAGLLLALIF